MAPAVVDPWEGWGEAEVSRAGGCPWVLWCWDEAELVDIFGKSKGNEINRDKPGHEVD